MNIQHNEQAALNELVARGLKIPPWPKVMHELQQALADNADVRIIARIISQDPGLASMVFKVARSPIIAKGRQKLERLDQILVLMGTRQIFHLAQAVALGAAFSSGNRKAFNVFWTRSAEIADLAALIAKQRISICNVAPEQAYMAGIFRECGIAVLMQRFPHYGRHIDFDQAQCASTIHEEDQRFNVNHSTIGYLVARHWKLPDSVAVAILYHCDMPHEELGAVRVLAAILHLANHCYNRAQRIGTPDWDALRDEVLGELGIHAEEESDFLADIEEQFHAAR